MREVVACAVLAGCGFHGAPANGVIAGDAPGNIDSPASVDAREDDAAISPDAAMVDAAVPLDAAMVDAAVPPDAPPVYRDCLAAYQAGIHSDGPQPIQPPGALAAFTAYCDMTTPPGGWTLVAGYTFANYASFGSGSNAITPRPAWPLPVLTQSVPISTTPPVSPADHAAIDYALWTALGPSFLIRSNVNNWISCTAGTGGLAPMIAGTISCSVAKVVNNTNGCTTVAPAHLQILSDGPILNVGSNYFSAVYYFDGSLSVADANWPTHDPCGSDSPNQLTGISNPGGAIFLHR